MTIPQETATPHMRSFAIVLVCYNRIDGLKKLVASLERVDYDGRKDIELIFSIDNSGSGTVADFASRYSWPHGHKTIRTFEKRQGLKQHILQCGDYTNEFDVVVVLEDDIFVSDSMYHYAYQASDYYRDDDRIAGISLYSIQKNRLKWLLRFEPQRSVHDVYFLKMAQSWGQVWLKPKWLKFKEWLAGNEPFEKKESLPRVLNLWPDTSWLKYHDKYCIETGRYFVYPYCSLSTNFSNPGEHNRTPRNDFQVELQYGKKQYSFVPFSDADVIYDEFMEREHLGRCLGIPDEELTVDIWGTKPQVLYKRYLLTVDELPYRRVKAFSLSLRPAELNVTAGSEGNDIILYDTQEREKGKRVNMDYVRYQYSMRTCDYRLLTKIALKMSFRHLKAKMMPGLGKSK